MSDDTRIFRLSVIPDSTIEEAARSMEAIAQRAELGIRQARQSYDDLFERISNEVAARLNEEVPVPEMTAIASVVQSVFEKYFGHGFSVHVEEVARREMERQTERCILAAS